MKLRSSAVVIALILFGGEGVCNALCAPDAQADGARQEQAMPACHETAPSSEPDAPAAEHECSGVCTESLLASSVELPAPTPAAGVALRLESTETASRCTRMECAGASEDRPPTPPRFLLHASFLI